MTDILEGVEAARDNSVDRRRRLRGHFRFVVCEPFFQFVVIGLVIWCGVEYWNADRNRYTINVGSAERERIALSYKRQFGQLPGPRELQSLVDRYIREEIFLREGLALHLDRDDEIVRRRIVQKYEFLQTDLAVPDMPGEQDLARWYANNKQAYMTPARVAFSHIYFSGDQDGEEGARRRAATALRELRESGATRADLGDPFPSQPSIGTLTPPEVTKIFGQSEVATRVFEMPLGQWAGPYRSGYGWHLVNASQRWPSELRPLAEIRQRVLDDYVEEQRRLLNSRNFEKLRALYSGW